MAAPCPARPVVHNAEQRRNRGGRRAPHTPVADRESSVKAMTKRRHAAGYDNNGDHAGSEANPGVGMRCSLRPEMSTV